MNINQEYFIVSELHYKIEQVTDDIKINEEIIEENIKFLLGIHENLEKAFIEINADINTFIEFGEEKIPFRQVQITLKNYYVIEGATSQEKISDIMTDDLFTANVQNQLGEVIRNITKIDYQPPIIIPNEPITIK